MAAIDRRSTHPQDPLEGKIVYVLVMTVLVQFLYPISAGGSPLVLVLYQIFFMSLFVAGIYLVSSNKIVMWLLAAAGLASRMVGLYAGQEAEAYEVKEKGGEALENQA